MKKIFLAILLSSLLATSAVRAEFYIGADLIGSSAKFKMKSNPDTDADFALYSVKNKTSNKIGGGLNFGYKFHIKKFFIAPEFAYEYLNNRAALRYEDDLLPNGSHASRSLQLESRTIVRLVSGYYFTNKSAFFASIGYSDPEIQVASQVSSF